MHSLKVAFKSGSATDAYFRDLLAHRGRNGCDYRVPRSVKFSMAQDISDLQASGGSWQKTRTGRHCYLLNQGMEVMKLGEGDRE